MKENEPNIVVGVFTDILKKQSQHFWWKTWSNFKKYLKKKRK